MKTTTPEHEVFPEKEMRSRLRIPTWCSVEPKMAQDTVDTDHRLVV